MTLVMSSPRAITGPQLTWVLITIYWCQCQAADSILGTAIHALLTEDKLSVRLLLYLTRCWDAPKPPPQDFETLCQDLTRALTSGSASTLSNWPHDTPHDITSEQHRQVTSLVGWLETRWQDIVEVAFQSPGALAVQLVRIMETAAFCLEEERSPEEQQQNDSALERFVDRRSSLGLPIRRMRLALEVMDEMAQMDAIADDLYHWHQAISFPTTSARRGDKHVASLEELPSRMGVYSELQQARHRGDYFAALELIHQFFSYAPPVPHTSVNARTDAVAPDGISSHARTKLHHQALVALAAFHVEWMEWDMAEETLKEAIQLCRAEHDNSALSTCQSLNKRIRAARTRSKVNESSRGAAREKMLQGGVSQWRLQSRPHNTQGAQSASTGPSSQAKQTSHDDAPRLTADDLWAAIQSSREGFYSLNQIIDELEEASLSLASSLSGSTGTGGQAGTNVKLPAAVPSGEPPQTIIAASSLRPWATLAYLHSRAGNIENARTYRAIARSEPYTGSASYQRQDDELSMRIQEAWELAEAGEYEKALLIMLDVRFIVELGFSAYRRWTFSVWRILHQAKRRQGNEYDRRRISRLATGGDQMIDELEGWEDVERSQIDGEPTDQPPLLHLIDVQLSLWLQHVEDIIESGNGERVSALNGKLLRATIQMGRPVAERRARLLQAQIQGFSSPGAESEALKTVETILPAALADHNVERKGEACWMYARLILAHAKAKAKTQAASDSSTAVANQYDVADVHKAIHWLRRAEAFFRKASPGRLATEVEGRDTPISPRTSPKLLLVLRYLAHLYDHLGETQEGKLYREQAHGQSQALAQLGSGRVTQLDDLLSVDRWQELIARTGAKIATRQK